MLPLQIEQIALKWTDYGVMGLVIAGLLFITWKLFSQQQKYTEGWREEAKEMSSNFVSLVSKQNETNQRLIDIREKDVAQSKEFQDNISRKVEELPERMIKEIKYLELQKNQNQPNTTSSS